VWVDKDFFSETQKAIILIVKMEKLYFIKIKNLYSSKEKHTIKTINGVGDVGQLVEYFPSMQWTLGSIPSTAKEGRKNRRKGGRTEEGRKEGRK
jgi:hypothetical protein